MFEILITEEFENDFNKLDKSLKTRIGKVIEQLKTSPYAGKPLGYPFFREKKIGKYRLYYLIYKEFLVVFMIAVSEKKDQQATINSINRLIPFYREEVRKRFTK